MAVTSIVMAALEAVIQGSTFDVCMAGLSRGMTLIKSYLNPL
jgi:hypothetical protein